VPGKERGERLSHSSWILHVEEVRRARQFEGLDVRKPGQQELPPLWEGGSAVFPDHDEHGLSDASGVTVP
jgi:hypothetical protein